MGGHLGCYSRILHCCLLCEWSYGSCVVGFVKPPEAHLTSCTTFQPRPATDQLKHPKGEATHEAICKEDEHSDPKKNKAGP